MNKLLIPLLSIPLFFVPPPQPPAGQTGLGIGQLRVSVSNPPKQTVTLVGAATPNAFPLPNNTSVCIVTRNIAQSPGIDYNITSLNVVFLQIPSVGDVVQLNCW